MKTRTSIIVLLDLLFLLLMLGLIVTGWIMFALLPAGTGHSLQLFGLGRHDYGWIHSYLALSVIVVLIVHLLLHWNWIYRVVGNLFSRRNADPRRQRSWGFVVLGGLVFLMSAGLFWASGHVEQISNSAHFGDNSSARQRRNRLPDESIKERETSVVLETKAQETEPGVAQQQSAPSKTELIEHDKHLEDCAAGASINGRTSLAEAAIKCGMGVEQLRKLLKLPDAVEPGERLGRIKRRFGVSIYDVRKIACRN